MAVTTSQQISRYYEQFQNTDVTFTKEIIRALLLNNKQVFLKCLGYQWPCVIYSSSMTGAKIIANLQQALKDALKKSNNTVSLRYSFQIPEKSDPLSFFITARVVGLAPYGDPEKGMTYLHLQYGQRPPDDFIERIGALLQAGISSKKRREERIIVTPESVKKLRLGAKTAILTVAHVPRKGIIRDISFGGCKVIMQAIPQFVLEKPVLVEFAFEDPTETISIPGKLVRHEPVEGRTDISAFAVQFADETVPINYKMRLSEYLRSVRTYGSG
jgi:hypothetical protein